MKSYFLKDEVNPNRVHGSHTRIGQGLYSSRGWNAPKGRDVFSSPPSKAVCVCVWILWPFVLVVVQHVKTANSTLA